MKWSRHKKKDRLYRSITAVLPLVLLVSCLGALTFPARRLTPCSPQKMFQYQNEHELLQVNIFHFLAEPVVRNINFGSSKFEPDSDKVYFIGAF